MGIALFFIKIENARSHICGYPLFIFQDGF